MRSHTVATRRIAGAVAVLALLTAACGGSGTDGADGDRLPAVDVAPIDGGEPVSLAEIDGPAVINLWATWCVPCRTEIPDFEAVHRARGDVVRFVGINIGEGADRASEFLGEVGATYDQFLDPRGLAQTELSASALPVTVVIDADGVVTKRHLGAMDQDDLDAAIDEALAG